jgi:hypothetical protein
MGAGETNPVTVESPCAQLGYPVNSVPSQPSGIRENPGLQTHNCGSAAQAERSAKSGSGAHMVPGDQRAPGAAVLVFKRFTEYFLKRLVFCYPTRHCGASSGLAEMSNP